MWIPAASFTYTIANTLIPKFSFFLSFSQHAYAAHLEIFQLHAGDKVTNRGLNDIAGTSGWELALVTTPSNHTSQAPDCKMVCFLTVLISIFIIPFRLECRKFT